MGLKTSQEVSTLVSVYIVSITVTKFAANNHMRLVQVPDLAYESHRLWSASHNLVVTKPSVIVT